ncbi:MAG: hypothetical protein AAB566_00670 [Patescibacteria group bacterium]
MNKYLWVLVIVVAAAAVYFLAGAKSQQYLGYLGLESISPSPSDTPVGTAAKKTATKVATPGPTPSQPYSQLVKEYEGRRIQFDDRCQAIPKDPTYKNGTAIMLDNRSAQVRVVTVGGVQYSLAGYGYRLLSLSSPSLPKELSISCGLVLNVGRILLQAQILPQ